MTYLLGDPVIYPRDLCEHFVGHRVLELLVQRIDDHDGMSWSRNPRIFLVGLGGLHRDGFRVFHFCAPQMLAAFEPERIEEAVKLREVLCGSGAWVQGQSYSTIKESPGNLQTNSSRLQHGCKPFGLPAAKHPAKSGQVQPHSHPRPLRALRRRTEQFEEKHDHHPPHR
jgi:hypothetical protein